MRRGPIRILVLLASLLLLPTSNLFAQVTEPCTGTGALSGSWTQAAVSGTTTTVARVGGVCQPDAPVTSRDIIAYNSGGTFANDQYAQGLVNVDTAPHYTILAVRASGSNGTFNCYYIAFTTSDMYISKYVSGAGTDLEHRTGLTIADGDTVKLQIVGTTITVFINGVQSGATAAAGSDTASGKAGMGGYNESSVTQSVDDWEGGDVGGGAATTKSKGMMIGVGR